MKQGFVILLLLIGFFMWIGNRSDDKAATSTSAATTTPKQIYVTQAPIKTEPPQPADEWQMSAMKSKMDDSQTIVLQVNSSQDVPGRFGGFGPARLNIRCMENTTAAAFSFNGHFMADIQGYGDITYRIDDGKAVTKRFRESTNNEWLGLYSGATSIPFIKSLLGAKTLLVRATPFNESPIEVSFPIYGLNEHLEPLRKACKW